MGKIDRLRICMDASRVDCGAAQQYVLDNFDISGEAQRMCANLFEYAGKHGRGAGQLLLDVLDGIGFGMTDLAEMERQGIIEFE